MPLNQRPLVATVLTAWLVLASLLTSAIGLSAYGYLVPAAMLLAVAVLAWLGRLRRLVAAIAAANLASGAMLVLVLAFGGFLGERKLDVSGVSLLANLLTGGPLMGLAGPAVLLGLRPGKRLRTWFGAHETQPV